MPEDIWVQAEEDFIESYFNWRHSKSEFEIRPGIPSLYHHKGPACHTLILKNQIKNQSNLTQIGKKYRLEGDFFKYLEDLERANLEMQKQLDLTVAKLEVEQLTAIRETNEAKSVADTLQTQMGDLAGDYRRAEERHLENLKILGDTLQSVRKELGRVTLHAANLEKRLVTAPLETTCKTETQKDNFALQKEILKLRQENQILKDKNQDLTRTNESTKNENLALLEVVQDYKLQINHARETENAFKEQSIAIEKLRDALESGELENDLSGSAKTKSAAKVLRRLPSKDLRLNKTETGWEWKPWIERTAVKAIHIDFKGLKEEFMNLKLHREEAFIRARNSGIDVVMQVASYLPFASSLFFEPIEPWDASPEE